MQGSRSTRAHAGAGALRRAGGAAAHLCDSSRSSWVVGWRQTQRGAWENSSTGCASAAASAGAWRALRGARGRGAEGFSFGWPSAGWGCAGGACGCPVGGLPTPGSQNGRGSVQGAGEARQSLQRSVDWAQRCSMRGRRRALHAGRGASAYMACSIVLYSPLYAPCKPPQGACVLTRLDRLSSRDAGQT